MGFLNICEDVRDAQLLQLFDVKIYWLLLSLQSPITGSEPIEIDVKVNAMSKRQFKSQASSSRALPAAFGAQNGLFASSAGVGTTQVFGAIPSSPLSYVYEPPDLRAISEPNVVVAYKNVQKKDSTTKAKALEDLQAYVLALTEEKGELEDLILQAWVGFLGELWEYLIPVW